MNQGKQQVKVTTGESSDVSCQSVCPPASEDAIRETLLNPDKRTDRRRSEELKASDSRRPDGRAGLTHGGVKLAVGGGQGGACW